MSQSDLSDDNLRLPSRQSGYVKLNINLFVRIISIFGSVFVLRGDLIALVRSDFIALFWIRRFLNASFGSSPVRSRESLFQGQ